MTSNGSLDKSPSLTLEIKLEDVVESEYNDQVETNDLGGYNGVDGGGGGGGGGGGYGDIQFHDVLQEGHQLVESGLTEKASKNDDSKCQQVQFKEGDSNITLLCIEASFS